MSAVTVDLGPIIDHLSNLSVGTYVGYGIRIFGLLALGGIIAILNDEVKKPLALVQLGIAAPALITAYISGKVPSQPSDHVSISIIAPALADEADPHAPIRLAGGFFADVTRAISNPLSSSVDAAHARLPDRTSTAPSYPATIAPSNPRVGAFCTTSVGRFGPGPTQPLGATCQVTAPAGLLTGQVTQ